MLTKLFCTPANTQVLQMEQLVDEILLEVSVVVSLSSRIPGVLISFWKMPYLCVLFHQLSTDNYFPLL